MRHPCPSCGRKYDLRSWQLGEAVECPNCQACFILAEEPSWTPEEGPASPRQTVVPPTTPCSPEDMPGDGPNWAELDPSLREREDLSRQARIKMAAGASLPQIRSWLEKNLISLADVEVILAELTQPDGNAGGSRHDRSFFVGAGIGLAVGVILLAILLFTAPNLRFIRGLDFVVAQTAFGPIDLSLPGFTAALGGLLGLIVSLLVQRKKGRR